MQRIRFVEMLKNLRLKPPITKNKIQTAASLACYKANPEKNKNDRKAYEKFTSAIAALAIITGAVKEETIADIAEMGAVQIELQYETVPSIFSVRVDEFSLELLTACGEWNLVSYCATNADYIEMQIVAIDELASARRYYDLLSIGNHRYRNREEKARYICDIFEKNIDIILRENFPHSEFEEVSHILNFILQETQDTEVARKILRTVNFKDQEYHIPAIKDVMDEEVAKHILQKLEETENWARLFKETGSLFFPQAIGRWRYAFSLLERNTGKIESSNIGILSYIAMHTDSLEAGKKAIDALAKVGQYFDLMIIAKNATTTLVLESDNIFEYTPILILRKNNGLEIGKYAIDVLGRVGLLKTSFENIASSARTDTIKEYAKSTLEQQK